MYGKTNWFYETCKSQSYISYNVSLLACNNSGLYAGSFAVRGPCGRLLGASLLFDLQKEPELDISPPMTYTFDFLEDVESRVR